MQGVLCRLVVVLLLAADVIAVDRRYYESCNNTADCESPFECLSSLCNCDTQHTIDSNRHLCLNGVKYGDPCRETGQCLLELANTFCGGSNTCECAPGYGYDPATSQCSTVINGAVMYGGKCRIDRQCKSGMVCAGQICECRTGLYWDRTALTCLTVVMTLAPGTCTADTHCTQYANTVCDNGGCVCKTGYVPSGSSYDFSCKEQPRRVGTCSSDQDCRALGDTQCRNGICDCRSGYPFPRNSQSGYVCIAGAAGLRSMVWVALLSMLLSKVAS